LRYIATWDDHDYGVNDGGKEYPKKEESKKIFLDFFKEPDTSSRWKHKGIYTSYYYGEAGKKLQVIVLDCRTFRDRLGGSSCRFELQRAIQEDVNKKPKLFWAKSNGSGWKRN
jgi:hypothetical protein